MSDMKGIGSVSYGVETYGEGVIHLDKFPIVICEFSPTTNPADTPVWVDLSGRVRSFTTHRGRPNELDSLQAGTMQIRLDNRDRYLDPTYVDGPWYGHLLPMKRMRLRASFDGVVYDVFHGFVDGWPQSYINPHDGYVDVTVTDAFKVFANCPLPVSVYALEVAVDLPTAYWELGEAQPAAGTAPPIIVATDSIGENHGGYSLAPVPAFGQTGGIVGDPGTSVLFGLSVDDAGTTYTVAGLSLPGSAAPSGTSDFTVEFWMLGDIPGGNNTGPRIVGVDGTRGWSFSGTAVNIADTVSLSHRQATLTFTVKDGSGTASATYVHNTYFDNTLGYVPDEFNAKWHHYMGVRNSSGISLYVDGVLSHATASAVRSVDANSIEVLGSSFVAGDLGDTEKQTAQLAKIAVYPSALSAVRALAHYNAGTKPWDQDHTGARIARVLDAAGWPASDRSIDVGATVCQLATSLPATVMDLLQLMVETEYGDAWMTPAGNVRFRDRNALFSDAVSVTSQATFGDEGS